MTTDPITGKPIAVARDGGEYHIDLPSGAQVRLDTWTDEDAANEELDGLEPSYLVSVYFGEWDAPPEVFDVRDPKTGRPIETSLPLTMSLDDAITEAVRIGNIIACRVLAMTDGRPFQIARRFQ